MESPKNTLNTNDWKKWTQDVKYFCMPYFLLFVGTFIVSLSDNGFSKATFYAATGAAAKAVIDALANLYRKYKTGK